MEEGQWCRDSGVPLRSRISGTSQLMGTGRGRSNHSTKRKDETLENSPFMTWVPGWTVIS